MMLNQAGKSAGGLGSGLALAAEEMIQDFAESIKELEAFALLRVSPNASQDLAQFATELNKAEALVEELARLIERDAMAVSRAEAAAFRLKNARSRMMRLDRHLMMINEPRTRANDKARTQNDYYEADQQQENMPDNNSEADYLDMDGDSTMVILSKANKAQGPVQLGVPSQKQFEGVPKYMRSLLTYHAFEQACALLNLAAERKRLVMNAPTDRLGHNAKASLSVWTAQITPDVSNLTFITDEDVEMEIEGGDNRLTMSDVRAALQCLRNLDCIRVAPLDTVNRYVFLK